MFCAHLTGHGSSHLSKELWPKCNEVQSQFVEIGIQFGGFILFFILLHAKRSWLQIILDSKYVRFDVWLGGGLRSHWLRAVSIDSRKCQGLALGNFQSRSPFTILGKIRH